MFRCATSITIKPHSRKREGNASFLRSERSPGSAQLALLRDVCVHRVVDGAEFVQESAGLQIDKVLDRIVAGILNHMCARTDFPW